MKALKIFLAVLFWASAGYADVTVTLSHDGSGGVIATIQGSGTTSGPGPTNEADFTDIGDYTDVETRAVLSTPILFAPGISIVELDIDHDNKPAWPDDPDDFGLVFDLDVAPGTSFEIDGVSAVTGLSFSSLFPGTYSVLTDYVGVGIGTLIIEASPEEQIVILTLHIDDLVDAGILNGGQGNALNTKLQAAFKKLDQGKPDVAVNLLNAFINQMLSFIDDGVLTVDEGEALINAANSIIDVILTPDTVQYDEQQDGDISGVFGSGPVFQLGVGTNIIEGNGNGLPADPTLFDFDIFSIVIPNGHSLTSISLEEWGPPALANPANFFWRIRPGTQQPVSYQWSVSAASFLGSTLATIAADVAAIPLNLDAYTINNSGSLATGGLPYRWVFVIE